MSLPPTPLLDDIRSEIHARGPMTVARFMELALYDPSHGYYARAALRSGREGDFYTSVDAGPMFGRLLAALVAAAWRARGEPARFDLVEAGAGNGRLARDLLDGLTIDEPDCYACIRLTLVERSAVARASQAETLARHQGVIGASMSDLPSQVTGVLYANELLDAFAVHRVRLTAQGLTELYVVEQEGRLVLADGPPSTPRLASYFERTGVVPAAGSVVDISLAAIDWCAAAAASLQRGYLLLIDYGHRAERLYGGPHAAGTLQSFTRHLVDAPPSPARASVRPAASAAPGPDTPAWLEDPGERDLTAHVDFSVVEATLAGRGLVRLAMVDQARFLLALGLAARLESAAGRGLADVRTRLAARVLVAPDGLGGSHQALLLGTAGARPLPFPFEAPWPSRG